MSSISGRIKNKFKRQNGQVVYRNYDLKQIKEIKNKSIDQKIASKLNKYKLKHKKNLITYLEMLESLYLR